jgi:nicotinamide phosphoribosyltransferase
MIYGDSITLKYAKEIVERLEAKGFASTIPVLGIGSYTYQYTTRDTFGFAIKSTYGEINGEPKEIFKEPKTDSGLKNSAKGLTAVFEKDGTFILKEQATWDEVNNCVLQTIFKDGKIIKEYTLQEIRTRLLSNL